MFSTVLVLKKYFNFTLNYLKFMFGVLWESCPIYIELANSVVLNAAPLNTSFLSQNFRIKSVLAKFEWEQIFLF